MALLIAFFSVSPGAVSPGSGSPDFGDSPNWRLFCAFWRANYVFPPQNEDPIGFLFGQRETEN